ncbi:MAG: porin [Steroidobacteraceae bacterium]|jgi:predicted porin
MNNTNGFRPTRRFAGSGLGYCGLVLLGALSASVPALAQQKTGPGPMGDDALTWHGITLYGVVDIGLQDETHGAPFSDYRPAASGDIVQKNSRQSVFGLTPSNMGQSRVGLQGIEPVSGDWSAVFQIETFFNPQSGQIADSLKSLAVNNGRTTATSTTNQDGSSAGQAFQTAYVGVSSHLYGTITFGRQLTLLSEGTIKYDPNYDATAFGLLGASGTYSGGGSSEDKRLDSVLKYSGTFNDLVHLGAIYKFNQSTGGANTAFQANVGAEYAGASVDAYYSKINDAVVASSLSAAQVLDLPKLGYSVTNSLSATVSDNTAYALMALYKIAALKFFAGYEHIRFDNPNTPLAAGFTDIGGYNLAFVSDTAYDVAKTLELYWVGVRYSVMPNLDLTVAYYTSRQNAYGTGKEAGCATSEYSACSGNTEAFSFDADYYFNRHFDAYLGAMYSGVHNGVASGYNFYTTNIDPTIGVRYKF